MSTKAGLTTVVYRLKADLERERSARRIVDQALKEAIERAAHWENEAHTLGHIEYTQRTQLETVRATLKQAAGTAQTESAWRDVWLPRLQKESGAVGL